MMLRLLSSLIYLHIQLLFILSFFFSLLLSKSSSFITLTFEITIILHLLFRFIHRLFIGIIFYLVNMRLLYLFCTIKLLLIILYSRWIILNCRWIILYLCRIILHYRLIWHFILIYILLSIKPI